MSLLTPSQIKCKQEIKNVLKKNKIVYLSGGDKVGKKFTGRSFILDNCGKEYNLIEEIGAVTNAIELKEALEIWQKRIPAELEYVMITHWEDVIIYISSIRFKMSGYANTLFMRFTRNLEQLSHKFIITVHRSSARALLTEESWMIDFEVEEEDIKVLLERFHDNPDDIREAMSFTRKTNIEDVITCTVQAKKNTMNKKEWIDGYRTAQQLINTNSLDLEKEVNKPDQDIHMLGIDHIIEQINRDIINPIKINSPGVPICRGVLLYGPPGTGKTTIGRWLSYQLKGKVFLCERRRQDTLLSTFSRLLTEAASKAPAVVFVDDIDSVLHNPDNVRDLLVLLDGVKIKGRSDVTVVMTCMDISLIPNALHRGGRVEMCIEFKFPTIDVVEKIIHNRFNRSIELINTTHPEKAERLRKEIKGNTISRMSQIVNGWSPSNIHLIIDIIMRNAAIDKYDVFDHFVTEANGILALSKKTSSAPHDRCINEDIYI